MDKDLFSRITEIATRFADPRPPLNAAEAAGVIGQHHRAASLLRLAMQIDGYVGKIKDWKPEWLPAGYFDVTPDLHEAIRIIDGKE